MCYVIITGRSLTWFILSLVAASLIAVAIVTPKWLIGPEPIQVTTSFTSTRYPSVGIYTRCKVMSHDGFHCGPFDLDGFATDTTIYPTEWKISMVFITLGFFIQTTTVGLTLFTCCRQSMFGKSIHTITGSTQVLAGIMVMVAIFMHPLGWGTNRVKVLCSQDSEAFYPADCDIGWALYSAVAAVFVCFICGGISILAESGNMRSRVKRRVEGGEKLVCVP